MDKYRLRIYLVRHGHVSYFDAANNPINPKFAQLSEQG
ncbi:histidine phosphatase family protein, partial [Acinetobacter baumannii]